jgi:hypothetical protein
MRHAAARLPVSARANVKAVQRTLDHASSALTFDTHAYLFDDALDAVADRYDIAISVRIAERSAKLGTESGGRKHTTTLGMG